MRWRDGMNDLGTTPAAETPAIGFTKWLGIAGTVLGLAGTAIGVWSQVEVARQQKMSAELQRQVDLLTAEREDRKLNFEIALKVYEKVIETDQNDPDGLRLALALIEVLPQEEFRGRLGAALAALSTSVANTTTEEKLRPVAQSVADAAQFISQQTQVGILDGSSRPRSLGTVDQSVETPQEAEVAWQYNVFWCDVAPSDIEQATASRVADAITPAGAVQLRKLPALINARPEYQVRGTVIKTGGSDAAVSEAERLQEQILEKTGLNFTIERGSTDAPRYISLYVCS